MIRRGFWLLAGAAGGIIGYRRVSSLGRRLSATLSPAAQDGGGRVEQRPGGKAALSGKARHGLVRGTIRFTRDARMFGRDVREGMDLYLVRHAAQGSPTLGESAASRRSSASPALHQGINGKEDH